MNQAVVELTQKTSGESRTDPTDAILERRRKTSPIFFMISDGTIRIIRVWRRSEKKNLTFVRHPYFPCLTDDFRVFLGLFDGSGDELLELYTLALNFTSALP